MLRTKLNRPNLGPDLVVRDQLIRQLDQNSHKPLSLISAQSGYGKSILVSQWIENCKVNAAWVSLDDEIRDLRIFLEYMIAALKNIIDKDFTKLEEYIQRQQLPPVETVFETMADVLENVEENFALILDDYQVINNEDIHGLLNLCITYPIENLHLVIICRRDPPLKFNKLRLFNRINEIRLSDLLFSLDDTKKLVSKKVTYVLTEKELKKIEKRTEGWVLGIQMMLMTDEIRKVNAEIKPSTHYSLSEYSDFFTDLVLKRFSDEFRNTLIVSSILSRFNNELIDVLFTESGSPKISGSRFIQDLVANNLFVYSLDDERTWYRYHHFFDEMLLIQLHKGFSENQIASFHKNASSWFESNDYLDEAFHHALQSGDIDFAVSIFDKNRIRFFNTDQFRRINQWLDLLPKGTVEKHIGLLVSRAILDEAKYDLVAMKADVGMAQKLAETMEADSPENKQLLGEYYTVRSLLDFSLENYKDAFAHANKALSLLEDKTQMISNYAFAFRLYALNALGRYEEAETLVNGILESIPLKNSIPYIYTQILNSYLNSFRGNLKVIAEAMSNTYSLFIENKLWVLLSSVSYYLGSSYYQFNKLRKAVEYTEILSDHYYAGRPYWDLPTIYTKALGFLALGETQKLSDTIDEINEVTKNVGIKSFDELTKAFKVDVALRQGKIKQALELSKSTDFDSIYLDYAFYFQQLTYVRLLIITDHIRNSNKIEELLEKYIKKGRSGHKYNFLMQVLLMQSIYLSKKGDEEAALNSVKEAIILAEPNGFIRIFVDLGEPMKELLEKFQHTEPDSYYVSTLLEAFENERPIQTLEERLEKVQSFNRLEILSVRETETLQYIARGYRNKEIAESLNISVETVKSHVKNSLKKMKAKNRVELVKKAREHKLIASEN
ncbi:LuxR C-terminal-related transcriptional regulator [Lutimonas vermicola]|uniref:LuxR C-terminal-related transcriptional regulator n=1 Tax=Lutimonas vermicola TaxID=414288 RepID=A0ABU9KZZ1_9FLAO